MKFKFKCCIKKTKSYYYVTDETGNISILNVLLSEDFDFSSVGSYQLHEFVIVINKRGQLTCLCIK